MVTGAETRPIKFSAILGGDNRLEASTYLREGYGLSRLARQVAGCVSLGDLADIWQPSRLTGYLMPEEQGLPFFTAGQMFEDFPRVRKWLAEPFVPHKKKRYVSQDWLLMSCSGVVGRITAVYPHHLNKIVTHDLLRIIPKDWSDYGWLYSYMKTDFFQSVARASQYGHMIKHIEVEHADKYPVLMPEEDIRIEIGKIAEKAINMRAQARDLRDEAFSLIEKKIDIDNRLSEQSERHGSFRLSDLLQQRLRFDAGTYVGKINVIDNLVDDLGYSELGELVTSLSDLPRFSRVFGDGGTPYVGASELFDANAKPTKFIYPKLVKNSDKYILHEGQIIMACSGQKYGLLGRSLLLHSLHEGLFGSHDLIRIVLEGQDIRPGYLLAFLNDPAIGRPLVIRNAYGTSVPHLNPDDIKRIRVPRLGKTTENAIADVMEQSVALSSEADSLENEAINRAEAITNSMLGIVE